MEKVIKLLDDTISNLSSDMNVCSDEERLELKEEQKQFIKAHDILSQGFVEPYSSEHVKHIIKTLRNVSKEQDGDGHWYWIPKGLLCEFRNELEEITGIEYMDNPDAFDAFTDKFEQYRTLGDCDNVPDFFKQ